MADGSDGKTSEWRSGWPVVVASSLGMSMLGVGYVAAGTFIAPLEQAFGWGRAEISAGFIVFALIGVVLQPPVGMMLDRWGARRLAIPGAVLTGMAFALFSTLNGSMIYWLSLWLLLAIVCQLVMATVWTVAISSHFVVNRGRAFAVTMLGSGLAAIGMPLLSNYMIEHQGWRMAYLVIGLSWGGVVSLASFFMLHERRDRSQLHASASPLASLLIGYNVRDGIRSNGFIKIFAAILLSNLFYFGLSFHLLPILTWCGLPRDTGVWIISSLGISMIAWHGRFWPGCRPCIAKAAHRHSRGIASDYVRHAALSHDIGVSAADRSKRVWHLLRRAASVLRQSQYSLLRDAQFCHPVGYHRYCKRGRDRDRAVHCRRHL
jgi:MFS family permease